MAIASLSDLAAKLSDPTRHQPMFPHKSGRANGVAVATPTANRVVSMWQYEGTHGPAGAEPTISAIPTNATAGGMQQANATIGDLYCLGGSMTLGPSSGIIMMYDRLVHTGGASALSAGTVTTNLPTTALTRYTNGIGNKIFVEIYQQIGASTTTISAVYVDENNVSQTTGSVVWGGASDRNPQRAIELPLVGKGVKSVTSVSQGATGTAGAFGITIAHPLMYFSNAAAGIAVQRDGLTGLPSLVQIPPNACLAFMYYAAAAIVPVVYGQITFLDA